MNDNIILSIKNITKKYQIFASNNDRVKQIFFPGDYYSEFTALENISFDVKKGEVVSILGHNGAGKSTLLQIITGVLEPTFGEVLVKGKIASLLELGSGFNQEMTGIENIYLSGTIFGISKEKIDRKIDSIVEFAEIGEYINQPVKFYSSGMYARLAFSVYINLEADILIIDEILSVGDLRFQLKCRDKMLQMRNSGTTFLYVTHGNQNFGDWALLLDKGKEIKRGNIDDVWNFYHKQMTSNVKINTENYIVEDKQVKEILNKKSEVEYFSNFEFNEENKVTMNYIYSNDFMDKVNDIRFGSGEAKIVNTQLLNKEILEEVCTVGYGEQLIYRLHIKVYKYVPFLAVGFMIRNGSGIHIQGTETWAERQPLFDLNKDDEIVIDFSIDVCFAEGEYTITPGMSYRNVEMDGETGYYDWIDNIDKITVLRHSKPFHALYYKELPLSIKIDRKSGKRTETEKRFKYYESLSILYKS
jgi:ABC-type polysaccharide/polyol phosphate transport system ATPase subunit